jgi:hypothetical protein
MLYVRDVKIWKVSPTKTIGKKTHRRSNSGKNDSRMYYLCSLGMWVLHRPSGSREAYSRVIPDNMELPNELWNHPVSACPQWLMLELCTAPTVCYQISNSRYIELPQSLKTLRTLARTDSICQLWISTSSMSFSQIIRSVIERLTACPQWPILEYCTAPTVCLHRICSGTLSRTAILNSRSLSRLCAQWLGLTQFANYGSVHRL